MSERAELIEKIARRMATELGHDPDDVVETGYGDHAQKGPYWMMQREWAIRHLAACDVLREEGYAA